MKVSLGSFLEEITEKTTKNDQYPVLTSSKSGLFLQSDYFNKQVASKDNTGYKIIRKGQFTYRAMSDTGEFFPNMLECAEIGIVSPAYPVFGISRENVVEPEYLKYFFQSDEFQHSISSFAQGSTRTSVKFEKMKTVLINLPSLEEQKKTILKLDKVADLISLRKQQLAKLDEAVKARFVEMFGDPILNQKGFPVYRMDEVVTFQGGSQPDKKFFEYVPTADNIRLIQIRDYKTDNYITYIPKSKAKRFCTADDIMIGRYGPPIFQILQGIEGSFNVALMKATPKIGRREFIRYFLKQDCLLRYLEGMSQRTAGQDGIQMDKLKAYPVPMPPEDMQIDFENLVKKIKNQKATIQQSLEHLEMLKKSLMQQYFG